MIIKKIKDWLTSSRPQFEVIERFSVGPGTQPPIKKAKRIKDDARFYLFGEALYKGEQLRINSFNEDLVHVNLISIVPGIEFFIENGKTKTRTVNLKQGEPTITVCINDIEQDPNCFFAALDRLPIKRIKDIKDFE